MTPEVVIAMIIALIVVVTAIIRDVWMRDRIQKLENQLYDKDVLIREAQSMNERHEKKADEIIIALERLGKLAEERMKELNRLKQIFEDQNGYV